MVIKRSLLLLALFYMTVIPPSTFGMDRAMRNMMPFGYSTTPQLPSLVAGGGGGRRLGSTIGHLIAEGTTVGLVAAGAFAAYTLLSRASQISIPVPDATSLATLIPPIAGHAPEATQVKEKEKEKNQDKEHESDWISEDEEHTIPGGNAQVKAKSKVKVKGHSQVKGREKVKEKRQESKKAQEPRLCPVCRAFLKKQDPTLVTATVGSSNTPSNTTANSTSRCENPTHDFYVAYHDTVGQIIRAGGAFSVMLGAATTPLGISTIFSIIGGILLYKGMHIFKKLVKESDDASKHAYLIECNDPREIQRYCSELSPRAQQHLNGVMGDLEQIKRDYDGRRISDRLYRDLCDNRGAWSLDKREPDRFYENIYTALLKVLAQEKSLHSYALLRYVLTMRNAYCHDRAHVARWYKKGTLLRDYYDDRLKCILYADEEKFINLFKEWQSNKDAENANHSFADYCQNILGFDINNVVPIDKNTIFFARQILSQMAPSLSRALPDQLKDVISSGCDPAMFEEAVNTHKVGCKPLIDDFIERSFIYLRPLVDQESLYATPEEWLECEPFAQEIEDSLEKSDYVSHDQRAFRLTRSLLLPSWFEEGNYIVVDARHNKGLELFDSKGEWKGTAKFNGTKKNMQQPFVDTYSPSGPEDPEKNKDRDKDKIANMGQLFTKNEFGKKLAQSCRKTKQIDSYTDSQIYEMTKDLPEFGLKKGDCFYLDKFHGNHLEVFRNDVGHQVLNLDGSVNISKTVRAVGRGLRVK